MEPWEANPGYVGSVDEELRRMNQRLKQNGLTLEVKIPNTISLISLAREFGFNSEQVSHEQRIFSTEQRGRLLSFHLNKELNRVRKLKIPKTTKFMFIRDLRRVRQLDWDLSGLINLSEEEIMKQTDQCANCGHTLMMHNGPCFACNRCIIFRPRSASRPGKKKTK